MKKMLKKNLGIYHFVNGVRVDGPPSGVSGDLSGVRGNLDECEITEEDRKKGIRIEDLIG